MNGTKARALGPPYDEDLLSSNDVGADPRWPRWGPAAVGKGIETVISVQLYNHEQTMGALNLFYVRIGQARGILMERFQIPEDTAFAVRRRLSQQGNRKLHLIADDLVRTGRLPAGVETTIQS